MRILLWSDSFWPRIGGVEVLGANFVAGLRERGHEVMVITDRGEPEMAEHDRVAGVEVLRIEVRGAIQRGDPRALARATSLAAKARSEFRPEIDHGFHVGPELLVTASIRARSPVARVMSLHVTPTPQLLDAASPYGRELRVADWVVACSRSTLDDVQEQTGGLERASEIENALPPPVAPAAAELPPGGVVLFLGRVVEQKGFDIGMRAFAALRKTRPELRAMVAGDGPELGPLRRLAAELGLEDAVEFHSWVAPADVPALMARASLVMMPSRFEPYGLVALEAAQNARPLVGFAVGGLVEAVAPGAGILVAPGDEAALARAAGELLDDPERIREMGAAARRAALSSVRWERHLDEYEAVFERVVASPRYRS
jgi:glycogen(starch) synthase